MLSRLALLDAARDWRGVVPIMLALGLSVSLLSASSFALDASSTDALRSVFAHLPADFIAQTTSGAPLQTSANISSLSFVTATGTLRPSGGGIFVAGPNGNLTVSVPILSKRGMDRLGSFGLELKGSSGGAIPSAALAHELGLSAGTPLHLMARDSSGGPNATLREYGVNVTGSLYKSLAMDRVDLWPKEFADALADPYFVILPEETFPAFALALGLGGEPSWTSNAYVLVWADRGETVPWSSPGTLNSLIPGLEGKIRAASPDIFSVRSLWGPPLQEFLTWQENSRAQILVIVLPAVVLGLYLASIAADFFSTMRIRPARTMKSKGASSRDVLRFYAVQCAPLALGAAIVAVGAGWLLYYVMRGGENPLDTLAPSSFVLAGAESLIAAFIFACFVALPSSRRLAKVSPVIPEDGSPPPGTTLRKDVILLALSVLSVLSIAFHQQALVGLQGSASVGVLLYFALSLGILLAPFAVILMVVAVVRITVLGRSVLPRLALPLAGSISHFGRKNLERVPRHYQKIGVLMALVIAFSLVLSFTSSSLVAYAESEGKLEGVGDVRVVRQPTSLGPPLGLEDRGLIQGVQGVLSAIPYIATEARIEGLSTPTVLIASQEYGRYVPVPSESYTGASFPMADLASAPSVLITEALRDRLNLHPGDGVQLYFQGLVAPREAVVKAVMRSLPSFTDLSDPVGLALFADLSIANLTAIGVPMTGFLVVPQDGQGSAVATTLESELSGRAEVSLIAPRQIGTALPSISRVLYVALALLGVGGLLLLLYSSLVDREVEVACMRARGMDLVLSARFLATEFSSIVVLALVTGIPSGILSALAFVEALLNSRPYPALVYTLSITPGDFLPALVLFVGVVSLLVPAARGMMGKSIADAMRYAVR